MKKLFAVLLALAMLLSVAAFAEAADVVGTWYLNELVTEGSSLSPATFGMEMSMTLNEDGTASAATVQGEETEEESGTWSIDGTTVTVDLNGSAQAFEFADGALSAEMDGMTMVFGQEKVEGEVYVPAEPVEAAQEDFAGSWTATKVGFGDTYFDWAIMADMFGDPLTAVIDGTTLTLNGFMFSGEAIEMAYDAGALAFSAEDPDAQMVAGVTAQILEDGAMKLTMTVSDDAVFILEKDA